MPGKIGELLQDIAPQIERFTKEIRAEVSKVVEPYVDRIKLNFGRCHNLVRLYRAMEDTPPEIQEKVSDILRAAVVFTHASTEDLLRNVAEQRMSKTDPSRWQRICFAGSNQVEKIDLAQLTKYGTRTAAEIVEDSIREHLARTSFNRIDDITNLMKALNLNSKPLEQYFSKLSQLMTRRHQIVHQADLSKAAPTTPVPISFEEVESWITTATDFAVDLVGVLCKALADEIVHGPANAG
jgi:hypothetical protein